MKTYPCPFCNMSFETRLGVSKHIKSKIKRGHGNIKCSCCKEPYSKCIDVDGVGAAFACKRK